MGIRSIEFRGKLTATGKWSEGNLQITKSGVAIITPDETVIGSYGRVVSETVGQYTGLTDKNDTKIFEGDVVKKRSNYSGNTIIAVVTYSDACFLAMVNNNSGFGLDGCKNIEVIGNIHDNPELLKECE